ncbi:helix-turn-helix transcriptional regulator [Actinoallomurus sp. NPDC050550]|uniref:helix-turn-helix domain-containing protein n=1 Tax=Actinoallomurus sp. NPDC050550 TaxID=3154937 RepID=UPI0033D804AB
MPAQVETVGLRIAQLRQAHRMTQEALGDRNCTAADVARFESGQAEPSEGLLRGFAVRLGCPLSYLRRVRVGSGPGLVRSGTAGCLEALRQGVSGRGRSSR